MFDNNPFKPARLWHEAIEPALTAVQSDCLNDDREEMKLILQALEHQCKTIAANAKGTALEDRANKIADLATATRQQFTGRYPIINRIR